MRGEGSPKNTIDAYQIDLLQLTRTISTYPPHRDQIKWELIRIEDIDAHVLWMNKERYAKSTIARKIASLRSFFQFLVQEGVIGRNPMETLASPRVRKLPPKPLTRQQVANLLTPPANHHGPEALRNQAMMELLSATGVRVIELVNLDLADVSLGSNRQYVHIPGNGPKNRIIPIPTKAWNALVKYVNQGRPSMVRSRKEHALFLNHRGKRITRGSLWVILKQYTSEAGITRTITPHTLRQSFATFSLQDGTSLEVVQNLLGHANISTTQMYTRS